MDDYLYEKYGNELACKICFVCHTRVKKLQIDIIINIKNNKQQTMFNVKIFIRKVMKLCLLDYNDFIDTNK